MKKVFLVSSLAIVAFACSNDVKTEEQEQAARDSAAQLIEAQNQAKIDSMIQADAAKVHDSLHQETPAHDHAHDHDHDHNHEGHSH